MFILPFLAIGKGRIADEAEIDGIGAPVVPSAAYATEPAHFYGADNLYFRPDELLCLTRVGCGILAKEKSAIDEEGKRAFAHRNPVKRTAFRRCDFRADAVFVSGGVIATIYFLRCSPLFVIASVEITDVGLYENVAVFRSAARAADMRLGETCHHFRHGQPSAVGPAGAVRPRPYHAERCGRPHEHASQPLAANAWVNIFRPVIGQCQQGGCPQQTTQKYRSSHRYASKIPAKLIIYLSKEQFLCVFFVVGGVRVTFSFWLCDLLVEGCIRWRRGRYGIVRIY